HHCRPNIAEGRERHHKLCHRFVVGRIVKMNEVIGTKSHPDSPSFNTEFFSDFARSVLPVCDFLDALEPLIREFTRVMYVGIKISGGLQAVQDNRRRYVRSTPESGYVRSKSGPLCANSGHRCLPSICERGRPVAAEESRMSAQHGPR